MMLKLDGHFRIENLRNYPAETVEKLRALLAAGTEAQGDPKRNNFYDVVNCSQVFFVHVSPLTSKVLLLAVWTKTSQKAKPQPASCNA